MCIADRPPDGRAQSLRAAHEKRLRPSVRGTLSSVAIAARLLRETLYDLTYQYTLNVTSLPYRR
jgi:hypothetical protein